MKKEMNNIEEIEVIEEEVMETETKQKFGSKIVGFGKKHGRKIMTGVAVAAVGLLGYALGQKKSDGEDEEYFEEDTDFESDVSDFEEDTISE